MEWKILNTIAVLLKANKGLKATWDAWIGMQEVKTDKKMEKMLSWFNFDSNFECAPFFFSPARHGEAQDMSGTWKENTNKHLFTKKE